MADSHKNFAYSTVATAPSPADTGTSLIVQAGKGTIFPAVPFNVTVWPTQVQPLTTNAEIVRVTAISTDTFTIIRAQESSIARSIVVGDQIAATITTKTLTDSEVHPVGDLSDVDTTTDVPTTNEVLKWNGADWVPAAYDYTFAFSINTFTDNEAVTQLIGTGEWKATGAITFDMTYNNGPPTAGVVKLSSNGGVSWGSDLTLTAPYLTKDSVEGTDYPGA